jgi:hypothetical protein
MSLMDSLIRPTFLYGTNIWGDSLLEFNWASNERVQTLLLQCIIRCKQTKPQHIILVKFGAQPFRRETIFKLVCFLHCIRTFADSVSERERCLYLAYFSSETISLSSPSSWDRGWFAGVSTLLEYVGIQIYHLPPFINFSDAPGHLPLTRHELNIIIRDEIYKYFIHITWVNPPNGLQPKMALYTDYFLELRDRFIVRPQYTLYH